MDAKLQMIVDHFDIREVIETYVHGCDRGDAEAVKACYWEDSYDNHGPISGPGHQFAEDCVQSLKEVWTSCTHLLGQSRIRVTGDRAGAETYYFASLTRNDDGREVLDQQVGRYVDVLERREDRIWRIKDRRCTQEWTYTIPQGDGFIDRHGFLKGIRSDKDISYDVLDLETGRSGILR